VSPLSAAPGEQPPAPADDHLSRFATPATAEIGLCPDEPPVTAEFDLCPCELNADDLIHLCLLIRSLAPRIRRGGSILVLHLNHSLSPLSNAQELVLHNALALDLPCRFHFAGSKASGQALAGFAAAPENFRSRRPAAVARAAIQFGASIYRARPASRSGSSEHGRPPDSMTSFVIEISVARHAGIEGGVAPAEEQLIAAK
jgi:hypothetical protein